MGSGTVGFLSVPGSTKGVMEPTPCNQGSIKKHTPPYSTFRVALWICVIFIEGLSVLRLQHEERDERDGNEGKHERGYGDPCGIVAVGIALRGDHGDDGHGR